MSLQVVVNFRVIDESDDWIVVDKPAPLIVHPANNQPEPTLLGGLEQLLSFELANGASLGIVTRLDRETSGVVLIAKHTAAARELGWVFERRQARKEYLAIVKGWPDADAWECSYPLARAADVGKSEIWVRQMPHFQGRACKTSFQVERRFERAEGKFALVRCFPETGRMHQIRVHLAATGFPILGDKIYSGNGSEYLEWLEDGWTKELESRLLLSRHALHAARLQVPSPKGWIQWDAGLPDDMQSFLDGREVKPTPDIVIWSRHD